MRLCSFHNCGFLESRFCLICRRERRESENAEELRSFVFVFLTNIHGFLGVLSLSVFSVAKQTEMNSLQSDYRGLRSFEPDIERVIIRKKSEAEMVSLFFCRRERREIENSEDKRKRFLICLTIIHGSSRSSRILGALGDKTNRYELAPMRLQRAPHLEPDIERIIVRGFS